MGLNLIKLCVGVDTVDELRAWVDFRISEVIEAGRAPVHQHITRMIPRRRDELLDGGSLYWVIKGFVQVRQRLADIQPFEDAEGVGRCRLVLEPKLIATRPQPRRPFQGWRYLEAKDAPADLGTVEGEAEMPEGMRRDLAELGLL